MKIKKKYVILFGTAWLMFAVYASLYIFRSSIVVEGERYFVLFDDAMISMRYARNLAEGYGPVMNPGERVEGFTNPLWVLIMAFVHLFPLDPKKTSLVMQIIGTALMLASSFLVYKSSFIITGKKAVSLASMILTLFYLPLMTWSLQGTEVSIAAFIVILAFYIAVSSMKSGVFKGYIHILLGIGTLVRLDMAVAWAGFWLFFMIYDKENREKHLVWSIISGLVFIGGQTLARYLYYGDILPNTYYLKMQGYPALLRISRGWIAFYQFIRDMGLPVFVLPFIYTLIKREKYRILALMLFSLHCMYSVYVGGDAWEWWSGSNRFISPAMPLFFILLSSSLFGISEKAAKILARREVLSGIPFIKISYFVLITAALLLVNSNRGPFSLRSFLTIDNIANKDGNTDMVDRSRFVEALTTSDATVAVTWAGILPYLTGRYVVDILGKTDRHLSRVEMRTTEGPGRFRFFWPGHLKWDYSYTLGEIRPDIVVQLWVMNDEEAEPYLTEDYKRLIVQGIERYEMYLRGDSQKLYWNRMNPAVEQR